MNVYEYVKDLRDHVLVIVQDPAGKREYKFYSHEAIQARKDIYRIHPDNRFINEILSREADTMNYNPKDFTATIIIKPEERFISNFQYRIMEEECCSSHEKERGYKYCRYCRGATRSSAKFKVINANGKVIYCVFNYCPHCGSKLKEG